MTQLHTHLSQSNEPHVQALNKTGVKHRTLQHVPHAVKHLQRRLQLFDHIRLLRCVRQRAIGRKRKDATTFTNIHGQAELITRILTNLRRTHKHFQQNTGRKLATPTIAVPQRLLDNLRRKQPTTSDGQHRHTKTKVRHTLQYRHTQVSTHTDRHTQPQTQTCTHTQSH